MPVAVKAALSVAIVGLAAALLWQRPSAQTDRPLAPAVVQHQRVTPDRIWYTDREAPVLPMPDGHGRAVRSILNIDRPMRFGDYVWNDDGIAPGAVWVRVDPARQILSVFRGPHEIGSSVILYGTDGKPTPTGIFPVLAKAEEHRSSLYDAEMPFMLRLTGDGVAIHASSVREGSATHGCVGVPEGFARKLFAVVRLGDPVAILPIASGKRT